MIQRYLDAVGVDGKCFVFCAIAPKGSYPLKSYGNEFDNYAAQVFNGKEKYIGLFDSKRPEILQDVAFKLFTLPLIGDSYSIRDRALVEQKRATRQQMEAFAVIKEFYQTVPHGKQSEEDAIRVGLEKATAFIDKYPSSEYDVVIKRVSRHEDGAQYLIDMEFGKGNDDYVFDFVYAY